MPDDVPGDGLGDGEKGKNVRRPKPSGAPGSVQTDPVKGTAAVFDGKPNAWWWGVGCASGWNAPLG